MEMVQNALLVLAVILAFGAAIAGGIAYYQGDGLPWE